MTQLIENIEQIDKKIDELQKPFINKVKDIEADFMKLVQLQEDRKKLLQELFKNQKI